MKRLIDYMFFCMAGGGLFLLQACDADVAVKDVPASRVPIEVYTDADGGISTYATEAGIKARLLFWDESGIEAWLADDNSTPPVFYRDMDDDIDVYKYEGGLAYQVGEKYPADGYYYATGYAPNDALSPERNDYTTLSVRQDAQDGSVDFLSCDADREKHRGSANDRFIEEEHELQFRHLTSRIRFVGIRDEVMWNKIGVSNVKITLHKSNGLYVPEKFTKKVSENHSQSTYVAAPVEAKDFIVPGNSEYIPAIPDGLELGSCYVLDCDLNEENYNPFGEPQEGKGTITLSLDVKAQLWYILGESNLVEYRTAEWKDNKVEIKAVHEDGFLYPGYEYKVIIRFQNESIFLQGIEKAWENGGTHYLPVIPSDTGTTDDAETSGETNE